MKAKEQRIKMIALDIDGTLLRTDQSLGELSKSILKNFYSKGVAITLSTGRVFHHTKPVSNLLGFPVHIVCVDGAYILPLGYENPILKPFSSELVKNVINLLKDNLSNVYLFMPDHIWCQNCNTANRQIYGWGNKLAAYNLDLDTDLGVLQIIYLDKTNKTIKVHEMLSHGLPSLGAEISTSLEPGYSQITIRPPGVNKGSGIQTLAGLLNIELEKSVVFGDWLNDIPMLLKAGLSVTPANSVQEVKAVADIVSEYTSDQDFVGRELEKLLLEKRIIA